MGNKNPELLKSKFGKQEEETPKILSEEQWTMLLSSVGMTMSVVDLREKKENK